MVVHIWFTLYLEEKCLPPKLHPNSEVKNEKPAYQYQDRLTIECNAGYTLDGQSVLTCQDDKTWDYQVPICQSKNITLNLIPSINPYAFPIQIHLHEDISLIDLYKLYYLCSMCMVSILKIYSELTSIHISRIKN